MTARQSSATDKALKLIGKPRKGGGVHTMSSAARFYGIAFSTIWRAVRRKFPNGSRELPE
jgi:hypothetical protein